MASAVAQCRPFPSAPPSNALPQRPSRALRRTADDRLAPRSPGYISESLEFVFFFVFFVVVSFVFLFVGFVFSLFSVLCFGHGSFCHLHRRNELQHDHQHYHTHIHASIISTIIIITTSTITTITNITTIKPACRDDRSHASIWKASLATAAQWWLASW